MALTDDLERALSVQQDFLDISAMMMLVIVMIIVMVSIMTLRFLFVSGHESKKNMYRTERSIDRMNENLREVRAGMKVAMGTRQGYARHKAVSEITDSYFVGESKDLKRIEQIKLMLSASTLYDGSKNQKLVDELKILEDNRKFHGINIVIKDRPEDDYRKPVKVIDGNDDDDSLVSYK